MNYQIQIRIRELKRIFHVDYEFHNEKSQIQQFYVVVEQKLKCFITKKQKKLKPFKNKFNLNQNTYKFGNQKISKF